MRAQRDALLRRQGRQRRGEFLRVACRGELRAARPDVLEYFLPEPNRDAGELAELGARKSALAARKRNPAQRVAQEAHLDGAELNLARKARPRELQPQASALPEQCRERHRPAQKPGMQQKFRGLRRPAQELAGEDSLQAQQSARLR